MRTLHGALRILHIVGLAMFLGSILGHIVLSSLPVSGDPQAFLFVRMAIIRETHALTLPGLGLLLVSGLWLTMSRHGGFFKQRWLTVHQILALFVLLNALLVLAPVGDHLLQLARSAHEGAPSYESVLTLKSKEAAFGATNLVLSLLATAIAVYRPRLKRSPHGSS